MLGEIMVGGDLSTGRTETPCWVFYSSCLCGYHPGSRPLILQLENGCSKLLKVFRSQTSNLWLETLVFSQVDTSSLRILR